MRLVAASLLVLASAACADNSEAVPESRDAEGSVSTADVETASDSTDAVASYAPREANGLPGHQAIAEVIEKNCPGQQVEIREASCTGFDEEPTEFSCSFEYRQENGSWNESAMTIAIDGQYGWLDIGGPECFITATTVSE